MQVILGIRNGLVITIAAAFMVACSSADSYTSSQDPTSPPPTASHLAQPKPPSNLGAIPILAPRLPPGVVLEPADDATYTRRTPFVPLDNPEFIAAHEATDLGDDELVLGLDWQGKARAYPIRMLTYHHIVNDTVAGSPLLITY